MTLGGEITEGLDRIKRLVVVDQKPIGRTPRSNLATYTGLLDHVRKLFAATKQARARRYDAGRFSFNVAKGRCETCQGEGFVCVELLFLPSVYAPCPTCKGARYNAKTLEIKIRDRSIADVLAMTVDGAFEFFADDEPLRRSLGVLREVGLVVEHDMSVAAASDWIIDIGPGAGDEGGTIVASGIPKEVAEFPGAARRDISRNVSATRPTTNERDVPGPMSRDPPHLSP